MKRNGLLVGFITVLSAIAGWLLSKATLIGRTGINLFYKEYKFLKTWWKGGLAVFAGLMFIMMIHLVVQKKSKRKTAMLVHAAILLACMAGLYFTYHDFRTDFSHRLLGERFHLGAYMFWIGGIIISIYFMLTAKKAAKPVATADIMID